jgi:hypothetical protein
MPTDLAGIIRRLLNTQSAKHLASIITKTIIKEQPCYGFHRLWITNTSSLHSVAVLPIILLQLRLCFRIGCTCAFLEQNLYSVQIR